MDNRDRLPVWSWHLWALLPAGLLWLTATILKETPVFWRNEGGFPPTLRAFILDFYYPVTAVLLVSSVFALVHDLRQGRRPLRPAMVAWIIMGLILGAGLALLLGNNLVNLIEGRPLHHHGR
jgi:hypothetical protein